MRRRLLLLQIAGFLAMILLAWLALELMIDLPVYLGWTFADGPGSNGHIHGVVVSTGEFVLEIGGVVLCLAVAAWAWLATRASEGWRFSPRLFVLGAVGWLGLVLALYFGSLISADLPVFRGVMSATVPGPKGLEDYRVSTVKIVSEVTGVAFGLGTAVWVWLKLRAAREVDNGGVKA